MNRLERCGLSTLIALTVVGDAVIFSDYSSKGNSSVETLVSLTLFGGILFVATLFEDGGDVALLITKCAIKQMLLIRRIPPKNMQLNIVNLNP